MGKRLISLSHPLREQLAEIVLNLPDFEVEPSSLDQIKSNRSSWKSADSGKASWVSRVIPALQQGLGLVNFRRFTGPGDLAVANGGFLVTDKPYVAYIEKPTQIYGYTGRNYGKPLGRLMLKRFLHDPHLKKLFFRTETALNSMLAVPEFRGEIRKLVQAKGVAVSPPLANPHTPSLERFRSPATLRLLFVSSIFYEKGGLELVHAFNRLSRERNDIELTLITKPERIRPEHRQEIQANSRIKLLEAAFSRDELFARFFNQAHVFVYPTYSDSFSAVVNEALSAYLPVLTSDFFSLPERIEDGKNGFLFPSPFPNYGSDLVIREEHFRSDSSFPRDLPSWQAAGKLAYVEDFLMEKMGLLASDNALLQRLAAGAKRVYEEKLDPVTIRSRINTYFLQSLGAEEPDQGIIENQAAVRKRKNKKR